VKVEILALCDFAVDYAGKLTIVGVFDELDAPEAPAMHRAWSIAIRLRFDKAEEGQKALRVSVVDTAGALVMPYLDERLEVVVPESSPSCAVQLILNIGRLTFSHFGDYAVHLEVDGQQVGSTPLFVRQS
jgi:hypothetical protein